LCDDGYSLKGDLEDGCTDDDECLLDLYHCDPMAECKNTNGSYECVCRDGFTGDGFDCHVSCVLRIKCQLSLLCIVMVASENFVLDNFDK
jgi:hypothetical protein